MRTTSQDYSATDQPQVHRIWAPIQRVPEADVIFVHGLDGNHRTSWGFDRDEHWVTWLMPEFPRLAFWSLSYPVAAMYWTGHAMTLSDRSRNVLALMRARRLGERPMVFVAHSMGGLLVKELLRTAGMGHQVWRRTKGVMFLSTPHTGADWAWFASWLPPLRPTGAVKELEPNSPYLLELKDWFSKNSVAHSIKTRALYETRSYPLVLGITAGVIVNAASADPGVLEVVPIPVDHDHISICKPSSKEDIVFGEAQDFLKACFQRRWSLFRSR